MVNLIEADEWVDGDELALALRKAIATLPEKQRMVFNMKYYDDMKYEQMSEILGTSVGAFKRLRIIGGQENREIFCGSLNLCKEVWSEKYNGRCVWPEFKIISASITEI